MATILRQQDSLQLTAVQADSLASMNRRYTTALIHSGRRWHDTWRGCRQTYEEGEA